MQGKRLLISRKGRTAIELIRGAGVELLTSPEMTGQWERRLTEISRGQASAEKFMENVKKFAARIVERVRSQQQVSRAAFGSDAPARGGKGKGAPRSRRPGASGASRTAGAAGEASARTATDAPARVAARPASGDTAAGSRRAASPASAAAGGPPGTVARCPRPGCQGRIFMGRKGYGCSEYRSGCGFVIWKNSLGKELSDAMVRSLIEKGKTAKLKFKGADGSVFEGRLLLQDPATGKLALERI
jgi:DNA topoisomerase-3